jgi:hypothetical protein
LCNKLNLYNYGIERLDCVGTPYWEKSGVIILLKAPVSFWDVCLPCRSENPRQEISGQRIADSV